MYRRLLLLQLFTEMFQQLGYCLFCLHTKEFIKVWRKPLCSRFHVHIAPPGHRHLWTWRSCCPPCRPGLWSRPVPVSTWNIFAPVLLCRVGLNRFGTASRGPQALLRPSPKCTRRRTPPEHLYIWKVYSSV